MTKDSEAVTTDVLFYGPRNTTAGGKWYKRKEPEEPQRDDSCAMLDVVAGILCCAFILGGDCDCDCDCDCCDCDCCPNGAGSVEYIYEDPVTKQLFTVEGYLCPKDTGIVDCTPEELDKLRSKYTSPVPHKIAGRS
mmetsp:Transcript_18838/g.27611  ORF Transcript_18838/g.27611 Transcript_18838/m.27611 type:complete len:136 (-) Transcript_18838:539-946(-)|eukprot:CAMPEP_0195525546 /NCGR_PEP_ID=MMETSP0794_2-20130614/26022_1 /TAXON_ID=515487 /ORGANISM="Stephanopyxis turris, Strain CCMP 815" /LENGTH=135 /DNA_ID=CAMNT_0040656027 /DNA_START=162 /DNA_END=569 /DNA_ORIENTATION=-